MSARDVRAGLLARHAGEVADAWNARAGIADPCVVILETSDAAAARVLPTTGATVLRGSVAIGLASCAALAAALSLPLVSATLQEAPSSACPFVIVAQGGALAGRILDGAPWVTGEAAP